MTIDEAIKHAEEVAEEKERDRDVRKIHLDNRKSHNNIVHYQKACECANEHRQLTEWLKDYKRLKEQQPCEDSVSREQALLTLTGKNLSAKSVEELIQLFSKRIKTLPPVTPTRKVGKWTNGNPICPCCGEDKFKDLDADIWADWQPKYCPNCGAEMQEDEI